MDGQTRRGLILAIHAHVANSLLPELETAGSHAPVLTAATFSDGFLFKVAVLAVLEPSRADERARAEGNAEDAPAPW